MNLPLSWFDAVFLHNFPSRPVRFQSNSGSITMYSFWFVMVFLSCRWVQNFAVISNTVSFTRQYFIYETQCVYIDLLYISFVLGFIMSTGILTSINVYLNVTIKTLLEWQFLSLFCHPVYSCLMLCDRYFLSWRILIIGLFLYRCPSMGIDNDPQLHPSSLLP